MQHIVWKYEIWLVCLIYEFTKSEQLYLSKTLPTLLEEINVTVLYEVLPHSYNISISANSSYICIIKYSLKEKIKHRHSL